MGKKLLAIILCLCTVLPLAACAAVDEGEVAPEAIMSASSLQKLSAVENNICPECYTDEESAAIWERAHQLVAEWNERYQKLLAQKDVAFTEIKKSDKEYNRTIYSSTHKQYATIGSASKAKKTRTLSSLTGWAESQYTERNYEEDEWGGFMIESMKQKATGYFYVKQIDGRWWLITPSGYPTIMRAVQGVMPYYSNNQDQLASVLRIYGSTEKWAIAVSKQLPEEFGIYTTNISEPLLVEVPEGFSFGTLPVPMITGYAGELGLSWSAGSTYFDPDMDRIKKEDAKGDANQVMPVFDLAFEEYADRSARETLAPYVNDPRIVLITTDNEIPIKADLLDRYLKYSDISYLKQLYPDNPKIHCYHETYAATVTWFRFMTGKDDPNAADITSELRYLFHGFVYDRLMKVSSEAIKRYDPNHIYAGNRSLSGGEGAAGADNSNSILDREWLVRFSAQYVDAYAINWYSRWNPSSDECRRMTQWTNDLPIFITEFSSKTDEGTGHEYTNSGGGFYVHTQEERGAMYENMTLNFLEWGNIVGWNWYRYNHYSTGDNYRSSTGILNDQYVYDPYLTGSMAKINKNLYNIIRFLDDRQANWSKYFG